jgi:hypothetical protein
VLGRAVRIQLGLDFIQLPITFEPERYINIFAKKNNKTLSQTLEHQRYAKLKPAATEKYSGYLDQPLGKALFEMKQAGDQFYRQFLNKYGDLEYSKFFISDGDFLIQRGIYAYLADGDLMYIGRCRDQMRKRINQGYGKIHPKNCYIDGQATNCHLNSKVTAFKGCISLWFKRMDNENHIVDAERRIIRERQPAWNIQR